MLEWYINQTHSSYSSKRKMNHFVVLALGLVAIVTPALACTCGQENIQRRIINGREVQRNRYPWIVSLLVPRPDDTSDSCAGTLINDRYILTYARCLRSNPTPGSILARIGAHTVGERWYGGPGTQQLQVESYSLQPPSYVRRHHLMGKLALIKLKQPVAMSDSLSPICLANFHSFSNLFVTGYGSDWEKNVLRSYTLKETDVNQADPYFCYRGAYGQFFAPERHICAGTYSGICDDDLGVPLSTRHDGHVYQVGVSFYFNNKGCQFSGQKEPDIYEKITSNLAWIEQNTADAKWCAAPDVPQFIKNKSIQGSGRPNSSPRQSFASTGHGYCVCGEENLQTQIISGKVTQEDRYPWMVSVSVKKSGNQYRTCGGSLINDRYVLTAAHCLETRPLASEIILMLGAYKQNERWFQGENREKLEAQYYFKNSGYFFQSNSPDELALIKLEKPVQLGNKWKPVCLPNFSTHSNLFVYGWGDQNDNKKRVDAKIMHEVEIDEVANSTCTNQYWGSSFIPEQHICAGTKGETCQGDSGGPVSTRHGGRVYQVGVASFGQRGCGIQGQRVPDISQRLTHYLPWIQISTRDAKWCFGSDVPDFTLRNLAVSSNALPNNRPGSNAIRPRPVVNPGHGYCVCGEENLQTRIINGTVAQKDRYPWMVSVLVKNSGNRYNKCGGSLINDRYVLTAAHCLESRPQASDIILMLGAYKENERWSQKEKREKLEAQYYLIHSGYTFKVASVEDVALIKLKKPVQLGSKWKPVCLPNFSTHTNLFVYGWGRQNEGTTQVKATVMHEIEIDEVANSTCTNQYWGSSFIPEQHICAGTKGGTCQGDSGGPVSTRHDGHVYQVGVVSFGQIGCGIQGRRVPDISQRVTHHLPWIQANTRDAKWCFGSDVPDFTLRNLAAKN